MLKLSYINFTEKFVIIVLALVSEWGRSLNGGGSCRGGGKFYKQYANFATAPCDYCQQICCLCCV